jgi:hypothetical protein
LALECRSGMMHWCVANTEALPLNTRSETQETKLAIKIQCAWGSSLVTFGIISISIRRRGRAVHMYLFVCKIFTHGAHTPRKAKRSFVCFFLQIIPLKLLRETIRGPQSQPYFSELDRLFFRPHSTMFPSPFHTAAFYPDV